MFLISKKRIFSYISALLLISFLATAQNTFAEAPSLYKLGVGDKIKIIVHGEADLTLETTLSDAGSFIYPFLGEITAAGLNIEQLTHSISSGLKPDYLINPDVNIFVVEYRQYFINGEVNKPGGYPYQPDLTLRKAVALAGGFTDRASKSSVSIIHDGSEEQNKEKKITLETQIQAGDIITVKQSFF